MTENITTRTLLDYLQSRDLEIDPAYLPAALTTLAEAIMEAEVNRLLAASRYERRANRRSYRNGYRYSQWQTDFSTHMLRIPKLRKGSYYPAFLTPRLEKRLAALALDAYITGVEADSIRDILSETGLRQPTESEIAQVSHLLEAAISQFRDAALSPLYACIYLDSVRFMADGHQRALLFAIGVREDGEREWLAHSHVSEADLHEWENLLLALRQRGVQHADYLISADFPGLRIAAERVYPEAIWVHESAVKHQLVDAISTLRLDMPDNEHFLPRMLLSLMEVAA